MPPPPRPDTAREPTNARSGCVAETLLIHAIVLLKATDAKKKILPSTSQSPAVKEIDVTFAGAEFENDIADASNTVEDIVSPTIPAAALSFVVVPTIPPVLGLNAKLVPVAAPNVGVINVGDVPNTNAPVPVSPVTAAAKLALVGVARNVATLVPKPLMPDATGNPVQFVRVPDVGVPSAGVTKDGDVEPVKLPDPVLLLKPTFNALFVAMLFIFPMW